MPYSVKWYIRNKVICNQLWGDITLEDVHLSTKQANALIDEALQTSDFSLVMVHAISDLRAVVHPLPLKDVRAAVAGLYRHDHSGWSVTFGKNDQISRFAATAARQLLGARYADVNTLEEALNLLREKDDTIDWENADPAALDNLHLEKER